MRWLGGGFWVVALLVAGCASGGAGTPARSVAGTYGTVIGTFQLEAGPVSSPSGRPAVLMPYAGAVRFKDASGHTVDVTVGSGKFSVRLTPGTYAVSASAAHSMNGLPPCVMQNGSSVLVRAGQTDRIAVMCEGP
jgi:hypothetical protein